MSSTNEETNNSNTDSENNNSLESNNSNNPIGYCHVCDRQVNIDRESFTCNVCHGGFIELFDMDSAQSSSNQSSSTNPARIRLDALRLNQANLGSLLPMLLPQLLNPRTANQHQHLHQQQHQQHLEQTMRDRIHRNQQQFSNNGSSSESSTTNQPSSANSNQSYRQPSGTRLQFIVPGEQFDLYGIINSVLSDVLDQRRQSGGASPQQFHFQAPPIRMFQLHGDMRDYAWGPTGLDTIITQLLNQLENTGPPPASDEQLKNLPVVTIGQEEVDKNVQCAVCMEDFQLNDKAKKLPCKHYFHEPCIVEWLKLHGTCPVCRKNLAGEDTSQREYVSSPLNNPNNQTASNSTENNNESNNNNSSTAASSNNSGSGPNATNRNNTNYYEPDFD